MKFEYGINKMKQMVLEYPFLVPFDRKITRNLLNELDLEINKITQIVSQLKKSKDSYIEDSLKPNIKAFIAFKNKEKNILISYATYAKKLYNYNNRVVESSKVTEELSDKQLILLEHIKENGISSNIKVKDLTAIYIHLLNSDEYELLQSIANHIMDLYDNSEDELKDYFESLITLLENKTNKAISNLDKNDPNREILRKISKKLKIINYEDSLEHDFKLDIIDFWLNDENSYIYLKRLLDLMPEVVNIKDDEGISIIYKILDYYFLSCKIELINQTKNYIPKEYYAKIFNLFINHPSFILEDKELLDKKIEEFSSSITRYKKAPTIIKCLNELGNIEKVDIEDIELPDCNYLGYIYTSAINRPNRHHLDDYTFTIVNPNSNYINRCYSTYLNDKGRIVIRIHTVDISEFVDKDSTLDRYLKNKMFKDDEFLPIDIINKYLSYELNVDIPSITYEVELLGNGRIASYDVFKTVVSLDKIYTYDDFTFEDELVKYSYYTLLNDFDLDKENVSSNLEKMYLAKVSRAIGTYFNKRNLPCVYRVQREQSSDEFVKNINGLNYLMGKIDKKDAKIIYQIICEDHNTSFYDQENIGHASVDVPYYLDLFNPLENYVTLTLQRLIEDFYLRSEHYNVDLWQQELVDIINKANTVKKEIKDKVKTLK